MFIIIIFTSLFFRLEIKAACHVTKHMLPSNTRLLFMEGLLSLTFRHSSALSEWMHLHQQS